MTDNDVSKPDVYCPKEKRRVPIWWCTGSTAQLRRPCEELRNAHVNLSEGWAKVLCFKRVSFTVRRQYFDQIVAGTKKEEIRADIPHWQWLLDPEKAPKVAVFLCGRSPVHRRWITKIYKEYAHIVLGRPVSPQGEKDLRLTDQGLAKPGGVFTAVGGPKLVYAPYLIPQCIIIELGEIFGE